VIIYPRKEKKSNCKYCGSEIIWESVFNNKGRKKTFAANLDKSTHECEQRKKSLQATKARSSWTLEDRLKKIESRLDALEAAR